MIYGKPFSNNSSESKKPINILEVKEKIIKRLKMRGPSLPVHLSKESGATILLTSALLSELASDKRLKISNIRVGGSPLYFIPGHEHMLERFYTFLPNKEKEAFLLLKKNSILQDEKLAPAIRVALRNIKDFAFPIKLNIPQTSKQGEPKTQQPKLFWRFFTISENDTIKKIKEKIAEQRVIKRKFEKPKIKAEKKPFTKSVEVEEKPILKLKTEKEPTKIIKPKIPKPKKVKEKSEFVKSVISLLEKEFKLVEEKEFKKRELITIIEIDSTVGKSEFLCIAKDKKKITENDLTIALQKSQLLKLPVLIISTGELSKKALQYIETWKNLIKFKRMV